MAANAAVYAETSYEAENATLHGVSIGKDHAGYTGSGFVDHFDSLGDCVDFTINISEAGDYSMIFRYANAGGYYASANVYFDGEFEATAVFPSLSGWDTWGTAEVGNYLDAGKHTVRIEYNNHAINIDSLSVEVKHESTRSLYLSNMKNMMAIWKAGQLCSDDSDIQSTRIDELRLSNDWTFNQIYDYTGFFRDETGKKNYSEGQNFESEGYFDENGILRTNYLRYNDNYPSGIEFSRDYTAVPDHQVIVTRYVVKNTSSSEKTVNVLDMLNPANAGQFNSTVSFHKSQNAFVIDRSSANLPYMALGAFSEPTSFQAGNDANSSVTQNTCSPWYSFNNDGTLHNNTEVTAQSVSAGLMQTLHIRAGEEASVFFYIAISESLEELNNEITTISAKSGEYWFNYTSDYFASWFAQAKDVPAFSNPEIALMYKRNLVMIKNTLRPGSTTNDGAHVATTNMYDYGYKVWTRDASVTAIALDAAGFTTEGERYWRWLAARQLRDGENSGSFNTCIDMWTNERAEFIEPEHDTIGWFLYGVFRHCLETGSNKLRDDLWPQLTAAATYVMDNIDENGFGPHDFSIFEDMDNYGVYTYTQALYVAGLEAMGKMALDKGLSSLADSYNGAASTIKSAINRDDDLSTGLWYSKGGYYIKDIRWDNSRSRVKDGSGLILFVTGVVDIESSRTTSTIAQYEKDLLSDDYGMARFAMDTYYTKDSIYSPSGDEAVEVSPSWPQISSWNALCSVYLDKKEKAEAIFEWFLHRTCAGYMVTGECVSDVTEKPVISTASEPTTAAAFILAALVWDGQVDMRIMPDRSNAGCYQTITVNDGCVGDWAQYRYVPYYCDERNDAVFNDYSIKNVFIANDESNLYIRIDNEGGNLPGYNDPDRVFQISAFFQDVNGILPALSSSLNNTSFNHSFSYAVTRDSTSNTVDKYTVGSAWQYSGSVTGAKIEWDTDEGSVEMQIPLTELGVSEIDSQGWIDAAIAFSSSSGNSDTFEIHYRLTGDQQSWLYGDFQ